MSERGYFGALTGTGGNVSTIDRHDNIVLITYEIGPMVEIAPYAMPGSPEFIVNISAKLHNKSYCYILQNHGTPCLGANIEKALKNAELLERMAQIYYYALTTGLEITRLPESSVKQLIEMRNLK